LHAVNDHLSKFSGAAPNDEDDVPITAAWPAQPLRVSDNNSFPMTQVYWQIHYMSCCCEQVSFLLISLV